MDLTHLGEKIEETLNGERGYGFGKVKKVKN